MYIGCMTQPTSPEKPSSSTATFAGGCFWCMEPPFKMLDGVLSVVSGYTGGHVPNPTYAQVCDENTGHAEAVQVVFDPSKITYRELLDVFWKNIDPTTLNRQFADRGTQYRTGIFYHDETQRREALESKEALAKSGMFDKPIVTEVTAAGPFYPAEDYHQEYYKRNAAHYKAYRKGSGREDYLQQTWGADH
jgi:methionine-S-sulfoxide reductase